MATFLAGFTDSVGILDNLVLQHKVKILDKTDTDNLMNKSSKSNKGRFACC